MYTWNQGRSTKAKSVDRALSCILGVAKRDVFWGLPNMYPESYDCGLPVLGAPAQVRFDQGAFWLGLVLTRSLHGPKRRNPGPTLKHHKISLMTLLKCTTILILKYSSHVLTMQNIEAKYVQIRILISCSNCHVLASRDRSWTTPRKPWTHFEAS